MPPPGRFPLNQHPISQVRDSSDSGRRAGLKDGDLKPGVEIRAIGEPSDDRSKRLMKAEKLYLGAREYVLYPDRD